MLLKRKRRFQLKKSRVMEKEKEEKKKEEEEVVRYLAEKGLSVLETAEKGRCLYTTKPFNPEEVIIRQQPYICVPNNSLRCQVCFTSLNVKTKRCSACHLVSYCGTTCQKADWTLHRLEKLPIQKRNYLTPSILLMLKLYFKRILQGQKVIPTTVTDNYTMLETLVSHMLEIDEKQLVLYAQMANLVYAILQWPELELKEVTENFSKLACNAHSICDSELRPLGTGLYPVITFINHSCLPNAVLMFEGRTAVVRAVQYIPKGTEVLISYIETAGSTMTRQKALKEQYFFSCSCPRCLKLGQAEDIEESAILEGYRCAIDTCMGVLLRDSDNKGFICQYCGCVRNLEEIKQIASEVKTYSEKATASLNSGHKKEAVSLYKKIEKLQLKLCHPLSLNLMHTRESLLKIFMELNYWKDALAYCRMTIPVYEKVYIGCHPMLRLQYYTCGRLEWLLGETDNCVKSLTKALDILRITHGTTTPFVKELLVKLEEARAEASFKLKPVDEE